MGVVVPMLLVQDDRYLYACGFASVKVLVEGVMVSSISFLLPPAIFSSPHAVEYCVKGEGRVVL